MFSGICLEIIHHYICFMPVLEMKEIKTKDLEMRNSFVSDFL